MKAYVNVHDDSGQRLPEVATNDPDYSTDVFQSATAQADAMVQQIIAANDPAAARPSASHRLAARVDGRTGVIADPVAPTNLPVALSE
jgi:hypothetical protein